MKKLNKILSSVLAVSMVISCCAMNAFAASKAHTVTIKTMTTEGVEKSTGWAAGDTVLVEVVIDNTGGIKSAGYDLRYDTAQFSLDTQNTTGAAANKTLNYIDNTWYKAVKNDNTWAYLSSLSYYPKAVGDVETGLITFGWTGDPIPANEGEDNLVIGKFYLQLKAGLADGTQCTLALENAETADDGENVGAAIVSTPVKVTVGEPAPEKEDIEVTPPSVSFTNTFEVGEDTFKHGAALLEFEVDGEANNEVKYITVTANNGSKTHTSTIDLKTTITSGTVKVGLNILNVPSDIASITFSKIVTSATAN